MTFREVPHEFYEGTNDHVIRDDKQQPDTQDFTDPATSMITVSSSRDVFSHKPQLPSPDDGGHDPADDVTIEDMLDWLRAQVDRDEQTAVAAMYSRDSRWETDGEGGLLKASPRMNPGDF